MQRARLIYRERNINNILRYKIAINRERNSIIIIVQFAYKKCNFSYELNKEKYRP